LNPGSIIKALPSKLSGTFSSLKYPNYRLWFFGQMISLFGTWMQGTAQGYLVYELTGSTAYLGYVGFASGLPSLLLMNLFGGVIADRISRRTLMVITQTVMMILAFILAGLVFTGLIQPWHIIILAFLLGVANAFDAPARLAFVVEIVDRKELTNAIALNATMFNMGTVFGPAIAGLTYAAFGPAWCFALNGISFLAVIGALLLMRLESLPAPARRASMISETKEGFKYIFSEKIVRVIVMNMAIIGLFGISLMTLLPAWSVEILGGDVKTNGALMSARGVGALIGAIMLAALSHRPVHGKLWTIGGLLLPVSLLLFSQSTWLPVSLIILALTGWTFITQANTSNAMIQNRVPDALRGRVMGIYSLVFFGSMPIGSFLAGQSATIFGLPPTVVAGALVCLATALLIYTRIPRIRKIE
jgi:MFS family permease